MHARAKHAHTSYSHLAGSLGEFGKHMPPPLSHGKPDHLPSVPAQDLSHPTPDLPSPQARRQGCVHSGAHSLY